MDGPKEVGQNLGQTKKESSRNVNRVQFNFPSSQRSVDDVNQYNNYLKEFNISEGASASLDIDIKERPEPCTVNPPEITSYLTTHWSGEVVQGACGSTSAGGSLRSWHCTETSANVGVNGEGDYKVVTYSNGVELKSIIYLPYDGCYLIEGNWGGYGVQYSPYPEDPWVRMGAGDLGILHNHQFVAGAYGSFTGVIAILGPVIHYMPMPNRLICMVEAKAGDTLEFEATMAGFAVCRPWFGTYLRGMLVPGDGTLSITLIALAEDVLTLQEQNEIPRDYSTPDPRMIERMQCESAALTSYNINMTVDFYFRLVAKGELPYPNDSWDFDEQWRTYFEAAWYGFGWGISPMYERYPWPAPANINELLAMKAEWDEMLVECPSFIDLYVQQCRIYWSVITQLTSLRSHYYETNGTGMPFYLHLEGTTEPVIFNSWVEFWDWVWERGYHMETGAYNPNYVWTEEMSTLNGGLTPWPPATTIEDIETMLATAETEYYTSACHYKWD